MNSATYLSTDQLTKWREFLRRRMKGQVLGGFRFRSGADQPRIGV